MPKLILTKGLPGSGKSHWAKEYVATHKAINICKDDLRKMAPGMKEKDICTTRNTITRKYFEENISANDRTTGDVIWSDTNLNPIHINSAMELVLDLKTYDDSIELEVKDFTDVPIQTCIKQDLMRLDSVGKDVIMEMYYRWLCPKEVDATKLNEYDYPRALIVDIDGTIALTTTRSHYDYTPEAILTDAPRNNVIKVINGFMESQDEYGVPTKLIIVSGRKDSCKDATIQWLNNHAIYPHEVHMRKSDDTRNDAIVKKEIYDEHIKGKYNVLGVFDDRPRVIRMWEKEGLTVFNVGKGYEF